MEVTRKENPKDTLDTRRSSLRILFKVLGIIPRIINPFWLFYYLKHNKKSEQLSENLEIIIAMSDVVNAMPREIKKLLTIVQEDKETITPQQSFIEYFKPYNLLHVNPSLFKYKFVELYVRSGKKWMQTLKRQSTITIETVNQFWDNFLPLIDPERIDPKEAQSRLKIQVSVCLVKKALKWRRIKRVLFSGTGSY